MYVNYNKQYDFVTTNHQLETVYKQFASGKLKVSEFLEMNKGQHYGGHFINEAQKVGLIPAEYRDRTIRALAVPNAFRGKSMAQFLKTATDQEKDYAVDLVKDDYNTLSQLVKSNVVGQNKLTEIVTNLNPKQEDYEDMKGALVEYLCNYNIATDKKLEIIEILKKDAEALFFLVEGGAIKQNELEAAYKLIHEDLLKHAKKNLKKLYFVISVFKDCVTDDELDLLADKILAKTDIQMAKSVATWDVLSNETRGKLEGMLVAAKLMGKKAK